jgi:hypothetical protein
MEFERVAGIFSPDLEACAHRPDGGEGVCLQLIVYISAAQVVDYGHVIAVFGQKQGRRPSAETVAAEYDDILVQKKISSCLIRAMGQLSVIILTR